MPTPKILLAEDNIINQEVAIDMISYMGYTADLANNGEEVLMMAKANTYDIILMDCQMPVMDGFDASRKLRLLEKEISHKHIIIALTGNSLEGDKDKCIDAGMDDFLSKPFSFDQLKEKILQYL